MGEFYALNFMFNKALTKKDSDNNKLICDYR